MALLQHNQFIELMVGNEAYAIPIEDIQEIIKMTPVTELPLGTRALEGVIQLRGDVVPVVSLRTLFGFSSVNPTRSTRIIIVKFREKAMGIIADQANRVVFYDKIQPPPDSWGGVHGGYFKGIARREEYLVGILKMDALLASV